LKKSLTNDTLRTFLVPSSDVLTLDDKTTVEVLKQKVAVFRDERDWLKFHNPKDLSMAISVESAELEELFLWKDQESTKESLKDETQFRKIRNEVADIGIYLLSLSNVLRLDLSQAIAEKLEENARKYPVDKSKGSSKKYNEL
jgi:NTP pyrophosphatase (non-canonical NTP hydrolase)